VTIVTPDAPTHWVFDVDACLIDSLTGTSLRPGARVLLEHLRSQGHQVILWSAGGDAYAQRRASSLGVGDLFDGFYSKEERDEHGRYRTGHFLPEDHTAVFVDDRPQDMPLGASVVAVSPYLADNPHDRGLRVVAEIARLPTLS
jgi:long-chain acyl-CoA synthetase